MNLLHSISLAGAALALAAGSAAAQVQQSDVSGVLVTGSPLTPAIGPVTSVRSFASAADAKAFNQAAIDAKAAIETGVLQQRQGRDTVTVPEPMRRLLLDLLLDTPGADAAGTQLVNVLGRGSNDMNAAARQLVTSMRGLLARGTTMDLSIFNSVLAEQFETATLAYTALLDAAPASFLEAPPAEFLAAHAVMARLTGAIMAAAQDVTAAAALPRQGRR
jgi:hypothetical protein